MNGGDTHNNNNNRFGEDTLNSAHMRSEKAPAVSQGVKISGGMGFLFSERLRESQRHQEIVRLLKSGMYSERPNEEVNGSYDTNKVSIRKTRRVRPNSSRAALRESRSHQRLLSQIAQEEEK